MQSFLLLNLKEDLTKLICKDELFNQNIKQKPIC